ncbi:MAG: type III glutamate--ammonia ligase [Gammaproteobacteria bacterium]
MHVADDPALSARAAALAAAGVKYLLASYVDLHGVSKCKAVPLSHMAQMMAGSELFTGAALDGVPQDVSDEEVAALPDLASLVVLPWRRDTAWLASDLHLAGAPFEACSRGILKRQLARAADLGFRFNLGIETEFFILRDTPAGGAVPVGTRDTLAKPAYDVASTLDSFAVLEDIVTTMNGLGWDVYSFDHEDGNGQFEIDFSYADALTMADRFVFFRLLANEVSKRHGCFATFMPKPYGDRAGSGAHFNMSLADPHSGRNSFECDADPRGCGLSELGYQFIAGVLRHMPAICAVVAPTVNSYKRLVKSGSMSGFTWAPVYRCYGNNNRTNTLRIPKGGGRVECRAADIACNPYLGAALVLAAGLEGISAGLDPGAPHNDNLYLKSPAELAALGIEQLPRDLGAAVHAFAADGLAREVFGPLMHDAYTAYKRDEWAAFQLHVSDWELERYLEFF